MQITPTYAGIDWSWQHHAVCVIDHSGRRIAQHSVPHAAAGMTALTTLFRLHQVTAVAIERGDGPLVDHLIHDGFTVTVISPRQVKSLRQRHGAAGNKDDRFDAFVLADALRTDPGRWAPVQPDSDETIALRLLIRARHDLIAHRIAVHNQLLATLQHCFPGAIKLFSELDNTISLAFLRRFPSQTKAAWLTTSRLDHWLRSHSYTGRHTATELIEHLHGAVHGQQTGLTAATSEFIVLSHVDQLSTLRSHQHHLETRIKETFLTHPDAAIFQSLPRAGTIRAAALLAELGDNRNRYPDPASLAAAAGVAPSTRQSGQFRHVTYRRGCNTHLRAALTDWAQDTPRANNWAHHTYQQARQRGCRHPHATRILAQAWTRILWRCWHDHTPYNPDQHHSLQALQPPTT